MQKHTIFYREARPKGAPAVLLLHGLRTSSHMFRNLIPVLAERYRVVAPHRTGFRFTVSPSSFEHTFDHLAQVMDGFTNTIGVYCYAVCVFDYGAPVGFRLALKYPHWLTALITQNGNAYEEGFGEGFKPIRKCWRKSAAENRTKLSARTSVAFLDAASEAESRSCEGLPREGRVDRSGYDSGAGGRMGGTSLAGSALAAHQE